MLLKEYERLLGVLRSRESAVRIAAEGEHKFETLRAILAQVYLGQTIKTAYKLPRHADQILTRFDRGQTLLDIAEWINLPPTMLARLVLKRKLGVSHKAVKKLLREPTLIPHERIRLEVTSCVESDEFGGPFVDREGAVIGLEYEFLLSEALKNLGLSFETEKDLRRRGCHKTPDVLLTVPVAFNDSVVWWIDSKAKFGDEYAMRKDYNDSVSSYVGRYGPGMVVYWFGYISDCESPMLSDSGVLVVDAIPDILVCLPGTQSAVCEVTEDNGAPVP